MTFLKDTALRWFKIGLEQYETQGIFHPWLDDWTAFVAELRTHFGVVNQKTEAAEKLENLKMKNSDRIVVYSTEFMKNSAMLNWGDEALAFRFYRGLPPWLQDQLSAREAGKPTTLSGMLMVAQIFDERYWERRREKAREESAKAEINVATTNKKSGGKPNPSGNNPADALSSKNTNNNNNNNNKPKGNNPSNPSTSGKTANPAPSTSSSAKPSTAPRVDLSDKLGKNGKLTPQECKRHEDNNLCLFCGHAGHMAAECRKKQASQARRAEAKPAADSNKSSEK